MNLAAMHVVVGVIVNSAKQILIAKRKANTHLAGLWEFPGGKLEAGEIPLDALKRELQEELGIQVIQAEPIKQIPYDYTEKKVLLDFWQVNQFVGQAH